MPNLQGPLEARLLAVERRHARIDELLRQMRREGIAILQGLWDDDGERRHPFGSGAGEDLFPPTPNTDFSGVIRSCNSTGIPADIVAAIGGTTVWTGTSDSAGHYADSIYLTAPTAVDFTATHASGRLNPLAFTRTLTPGSSNIDGSVRTLTPAAGYHCHTLCPLPFIDTLNLTSSGPDGAQSATLAFTTTFPTGWRGNYSPGGTITLPLSGTLQISNPGHWFGGATINLGTSTCAPVLLNADGAPVTVISATHQFYVIAE